MSALRWSLRWMTDRGRCLDKEDWCWWRRRRKRRRQEHLDGNDSRAVIFVGRGRKEEDEMDEDTRDDEGWTINTRHLRWMEAGSLWVGGCRRRGSEWDKPVYEMDDA